MLTAMPHSTKIRKEQKENLLNPLLPFQKIPVVKEASFSGRLSTIWNKNNAWTNIRLSIRTSKIFHQTHNSLQNLPSNSSTN